MGIYWAKDVEYGAARQEEKTSGKIHGCSEGGCAEGWCSRGGCWRQSEVEVDDPLW